MTQTFAINTSYIHTNNDKVPTNEDVDFSDYGLQLSRGFRALKIWMSLKQYGAKKYARLIDQNVYLAQYLAELINESNDFELVVPVNLSVVCFRYVPNDLKNQEIDKIQQKKIEDYLNILNQAIVKAMHKDRRALLSSTVLNKKFVLRTCIVNYRTTKQNIENILKIVRGLGMAEDKKLRGTV